MKRILLADLLKGIAAFFMVQIHITELFIDNAGRESLPGQISLFLGGPFAAVVFMLVMGYFLAKNRRSPLQNMLRGVKIFILGFILNIGLNFHLLLKIKFSDWQFNPLEFIFGVDILFLAGLSILLLSALKFFKKGQALIALLLLISILTLSGSMNQKLIVSDHYYILPFIAGNYSWSYFPLFPWLAYPLAGYIFALQEENFSRFLSQQKMIAGSVLVAIAVMVALFFKSGFITTIDLPLYYHHTIGYAVWALGLITLWVFLLQLFLKYFSSTRVSDFICWTGRNITIFFIIQWLIIGNISTAIYQTVDMQYFAYYLACIYALTVLLTFLFEKTKIRLPV